MFFTRARMGWPYVPAAMTFTASMRLFARPHGLTSSFHPYAQEIAPGKLAAWVRLVCARPMVMRVPSPAQVTACPECRAAYSSA